MLNHSAEDENSSSDESSNAVETRYKGVYKRKRDERKIKAELKRNPYFLRRKYKEKTISKLSRYLIYIYKDNSERKIYGKKTSKYLNCLIKDALESNLFGTKKSYLLDILNPYYKRNKRKY